jgi:hypothetical protein
MATKFIPRNAKKFGQRGKIDFHSKISLGIVAGRRRTQCDDQGTLQEVINTQCNFVALVFTTGCNDD